MDENNAILEKKSPENPLKDPTHMSFEGQNAKIPPSEEIPTM